MADANSSADIVDDAALLADARRPRSAGCGTRALVLGGVGLALPRRVGFVPSRDTFCSRT